MAPQKADPAFRSNTGWRLFAQAVIGRAFPRAIGQQRDRSWLFFDTFLPVLSVAAYVFVYRAIHAPEEYVGFVVLGGAMIAFWMNILWSMSTQLYWEKEQGNLPLFMISPAPLMGILLGMAVGGLLATTLRAVVIIALGSLIFQVHYAVASFPLLAAVFLLSMVALYGLGMMTASLFLLLSREAWHLASLATEPVYLLSGFYFPVKSLNAWVAGAASLIPLTLGLDAMRQLAFAGGPATGFLSVPLEIGILIFLSLAYLVGAHYLLRLMEKLARKEGRLTESRR
jgi:ABC-2 type transport system permease protein